MKSRHALLLILLLCALLAGCHKEAAPALTGSASLPPEISAFGEVFSGTRFIRHADTGEAIPVSEIHRFFTAEDLSWDLIQIAILDLDADCLLEAVLETENCVGYVILDWQEDAVTGTGVWYRAFQELKADGSYMASGSSFDRCYLQYHSPEPILLAERYETPEGASYYSISGEETSEEAFAAFEENQIRKENARWYPGWEDYLQAQASE